MKRRTLLVGLGAVSAGLSVGTGAFTSVTAERDVEISVVEDDDAFVSVDTTDGPNAEYADIDSDSGEFGLDVTNTEAGGNGLTPEAVTDAADVFEVRNQGTQEVGLTVTPTTNLGADQEVSGGCLFLGSDDLTGQSGNQNVCLGVFPQDKVTTEPVELGPGDSVTYGLVAVVGSDVNGENTAIDDNELEFKAESTGDQ